MTAPSWPSTRARVGAYLGRSVPSHEDILATINEVLDCAETSRAAHAPPPARVCGLCDKPLAEGVDVTLEVAGQVVGGVFQPTEPVEVNHFECHPMED